MELELPPELHDVSTDQLRLDIARLRNLVDMGYEVDGEAELSESLWVVYGRSSYDGEVILAEYTQAAQAAAVLRQVPTVLR